MRPPPPKVAASQRSSILAAVLPPWLWSHRLWIIHARDDFGCRAWDSASALTNCRPKALVPLRGVTLLEFWVERLYRSGFDAVLLNAYHLKDRLAAEVSRAVADAG